MTEHTFNIMMMIVSAVLIETLYKKMLKYAYIQGFHDGMLTNAVTESKPILVKNNHAPEA
ncbi:MAG TPA: hypothetical protein PLK61_04015 [Nitrosomonas sp.]|nr:hypothetical protein [Nitrosomonas sp.]